MPAVISFIGRAAVWAGKRASTAVASAMKRRSVRTADRVLRATNKTNEVTRSLKNLIYPSGQPREGEQEGYVGAKAEEAQLNLITALFIILILVLGVFSQAQNIITSMPLADMFL